MRWIFAIVAALAMLAGTAAAEQAQPVPTPAMDRPFKLALPSEWRSVPELSQRTREHVAQSGLFGGIVYSAGADSFMGAPGFGFHVTWAGGMTEVADGPATVRAELDRIKRSWCGEGDRVREAYVESVTDDVAEARLVWRHTEDGTVTLVKALAFVTRDGRPRLIQTTCDLRVDLEQDLRPICERILETLAITSDDRMALAGLAPSKVGDDCPARGGLSVPTENIVPTPTARMGEPPAGAPPAPGVLYAGEGGKREGDGNRKWMMLAGALLLIVAVYLTTRSRGGKSEDEAEDEDEAEPEPEPEPEPERMLSEDRREAATESKESESGDDDDEDDGDREVGK